MKFLILTKKLYTDEGGWNFYEASDGVEAKPIIDDYLKYAGNEVTPETMNDFVKVYGSFNQYRLEPTLVVQSYEIKP